MIKNYLKLTLRNIRKYKGYSFINIAGLSIGMMCCILILMWVGDELSFDRFHEKGDRIYRIGHHLTMAGSTRSTATASAPMGPALIQEFPEVQDAVRMLPMGRVAVRIGDKNYYEENIFLADSSLFNVFSFPLVSGDPQTALKAPFSVVISETMARKYFGSDDPIGKILRFNARDDFSVTGVLKDVPRSSHLHIDMLCSFETLYSVDRQRLETWGRLEFYTYLLLDENVRYEDLDAKFAAFIDKHMPNLAKVGAELVLFVMPLNRIHLYSNLDGELPGGGSIVQVYLFSGIALFILLIACINFINLGTARSSTRAQEVGMRKTLGAHRFRLIRQFLGESTIYSMLSIILAGLLLILALPLFRSLTGRELSVNSLLNPLPILGLLVLAVVVGVAAGVYPAFYLSSFEPVRILKGNITLGKARSRFRQVLVVLQFAISVSLIVGTITVYQQLEYFKNKKLGFDKEQVVVIPNMSASMQKNIRSIKHQIAGLAGVVNVAAASGVPGGPVGITNFLPEGFSDDESVLMMTLSVDDDYFRTLGMDIVEGRSFSDSFSTDLEDAIILNETALKRFGWDKGVGKIVKQRFRGPEGAEWREKKVIGVVKDFHQVSLHRPIEPLFIRKSDRDFSDLIVRISPENIEGTLGLLEKSLKQIDPNRPFDYFFLDDAFDRQYRAEESLGRIVLTFSILAVFIGCLGLFGMSSFTAEQRTKEIGVRKVLGATAPKIIGMLSKEFILMTALANLVAWPVSYYFMNRWLENFAYRANFSVMNFVFAGGISLMVALLTVSFQAVKAAWANPVDSLKYE